MDVEESAEDGLFVDSDEECANTASSYENTGYKSPGFNRQSQHATYENTADDAFDER